MTTNLSAHERILGLRMSEQWFRSPLDLPEAERHLHAVVRALYPGVYIEGPRLRQPAGPFADHRRRPDFAASLITGRMYDDSPRLPVDAHVELRLYAEPDCTTIYVGIGALGRNRPVEAEMKMLADFTRQWFDCGAYLYQVPDQEYAI